MNTTSRTTNYVGFSRCLHLISIIVLVVGEKWQKEEDKSHIFQVELNRELLQIVNILSTNALNRLIPTNFNTTHIYICKFAHRVCELSEIVFGCRLEKNNSLFEDPTQRIISFANYFVFFFSWLYTTLCSLYTWMNTSVGAAGIYGTDYWYVWMVRATGILSYFCVPSQL